LNKPEGSLWTRIDFGVVEARVTREEGAVMKITGCDFHPGSEQIAISDPATGEIGER
jgi:hypothetical protein